MAIFINEFGTNQTFLQNNFIELNLSAEDYSQNSLIFQYRFLYSPLSCVESGGIASYEDTWTTTSWEKAELLTGTTYRLLLPSLGSDCAFKIEIRALDEKENLYSDSSYSAVFFSFYNVLPTFSLSSVRINADETAVATYSIEDCGLIKPANFGYSKTASDSYLASVLASFEASNSSLTITLNCGDRVNDGLDIKKTYMSDDHVFTNWLPYSSNGVINSYTNKAFSFTIDNTIFSTFYQLKLNLLDKTGQIIGTADAWKGIDHAYSNIIKSEYRIPPFQILKTGIQVNRPQKALSKGGAIINSDPNTTEAERTHSLELTDIPSLSASWITEQKPSVSFRRFRNNEEEEGSITLESFSPSGDLSADFGLTFNKPLVLKDNQGNKCIFNFSNNVITLMIQSATGEIKQVPLFLLGQS